MIVTNLPEVPPTMVQATFPETGLGVGDIAQYPDGTQVMRIGVGILNLSNKNLPVTVPDDSREVIRLKVGGSIVLTAEEVV